MGSSQSAKPSHEQVVKDWDGMAKSWDNMPGVGRFNRQLVAAIREKAPPLTRDSRVLEVGAGTGKLTLLLAPHAGQVVACDVAPKMIETLDAKLKTTATHANVRTWCGSLARDNLPSELASGGFDLVVGGSMLTFCPDAPLELRREVALLKPGGWLVHYVWRAKQGAAERAPGATSYEDGFTPEQLREEVEAAGLEYVEVHDMSVAMVPCCKCCCAMTWYGVYARKPAASAGTGAGVAAAAGTATSSGAGVGASHTPST